MIEAAGLKQIAGLRHGFFTREGGHSQGLYASLNCGLGSDDDRRAVRHNRRFVADALGAEPASLLSVHQIHSNIVVHATAPWDEDARPKGDAIVTRRPGSPPPSSPPIVPRCSWPTPRSASSPPPMPAGKAPSAGVLESTIDEMERLGGHRRHIVAAVGPAIGQAAYEVGPEFRDRFVASEPGNARFFIACRTGRCTTGSICQAYAAYRLEAAGPAAGRDHSPPAPIPRSSASSAIAAPPTAVKPIMAARSRR